MKYSKRWTDSRNQDRDSLFTDPTHSIEVQMAYSGDPR